MFLSTNYRLKLEFICNKIANGETVQLNDMIWADKLAKTNRVAERMLRQARRQSLIPEMTEDSLDGLLNALDLGNPDPSTHKSSFETVDEIADFFRRDDLDGDGDNNWRRRD